MNKTEKIRIKEALKNADFSNNEVEIYLAILDYGSSKIGEVVKITGIQKSSCYMAINSLLHKGVIATVKKGKVSYYEVENPETLISYIEEKKKGIEDLMPNLVKRFKLQKKEKSVKYFKGIKGVKAVFHDIIREGKNNDVFGSEGQFSDRMPIFVKQYMRMQNEKKIKTRNLIGVRAKRKYSKGTAYKFVNKEIKSNVVTNIYSNKIAIIVWDDEPEAIIIENETAAKSYKSYFEFMWKNATKEKK
jgi:sugar-specific transcriptional regulator TrmB